MKTLTRRNVKLPFSEEQIKAAFVKLHTTREKRDIQKLKNIMLSDKESHLFNYSIPEMKKAISAKSEVVPALNNLEDLDKWLDS